MWPSTLKVTTTSVRCHTAYKTIQAKARKQKNLLSRIENLYGLVGHIEKLYCLVGHIEILYGIVGRLENPYGLVRKKYVRLVYDVKHVTK